MTVKLPRPKHDRPAPSDQRGSRFGQTNGPPLQVDPKRKWYYIGAAGAVGVVGPSCLPATGKSSSSSSGGGITITPGSGFRRRQTNSMTLHTLLLFAQLAAPASTPVCRTHAWLYCHRPADIRNLRARRCRYCCARSRASPRIRSVHGRPHTPAAIGLPVAADQQPMLLTPGGRTKPHSRWCCPPMRQLSPNATFAVVPHDYRSLPPSSHGWTARLSRSPSQRRYPRLFNLAVSDLGAILVTTPKRPLLLVGL